MTLDFAPLDELENSFPPPFLNKKGKKTKKHKKDLLCDLAQRNSRNEVLDDYLVDPVKPKKKGKKQIKPTWNGDWMDIPDEPFNDTSLDTYKPLYPEFSPPPQERKPVHGLYADEYADNYYPTDTLFQDDDSIFYPYTSEEPMTYSDPYPTLEERDAGAEEEEDMYVYPETEPEEDIIYHDDNNNEPLFIDDEEQNERGKIPEHPHPIWKHLLVLFLGMLVIFALEQAFQLGANTRFM